jgi:hypothetical protein
LATTHACDHAVTSSCALQTIAERAQRVDADGPLLRRQAYYLTGFDPSPDTSAIQVFRMHDLRKRGAWHEK